MRETTAPSYSPPAWSLHGSGQIKRAWETLDEKYRADPWDPRLSGARAAAEWAMGMTAVSPVTNERKPPDLKTCQWEAIRADMRAGGIGTEPIAGQSDAHVTAYARGASGWLFWWIGLESLPGWLLRVQPGDPRAS